MLQAAGGETNKPMPWPNKPQPWPANGSKPQPWPGGGDSEGGRVKIDI